LKHIRKRHSNQNGFTLIELIIYVAVVGMVLVAFVGYSINVLQSKQKTNNQLEAQFNARFTLQRITQEIREASGVNTGDSIFGADPGRLSLVKYTAAKNPTIIDLTADDGEVQIQYGASAAESITTDQVQITNLTFNNVSGPAGKKAIQIQLTVKIDNADVFYQTEVTLDSTVNLRKK
jgi:prepilin-type N-terminal cleavage/methylation domain-containing protein